MFGTFRWWNELLGAIFSWWTCVNDIRKLIMCIWLLTTLWNGILDSIEFNWWTKHTLKHATQLNSIHFGNQTCQVVESWIPITLDWAGILELNISLGIKIHKNIITKNTMEWNPWCLIQYFVFLMQIIWNVCIWYEKSKIIFIFQF